MKMVKSLLLGSAAGIVAVAGAQAADLPVKAKAVEYVKVCSLYGVGFYYIPGTDICMKVGGYVRAEYFYNSGDSGTNLTFAGTSGQMNRLAGADFVMRSRAYASFDTRQQTQYGTLRTFLNVGVNYDSPAVTSAGFNANRAFIQIAGFTFGTATSFYDFYSAPATGYYGPPSSDTGDGGWKVAAYTAQFGGGVSATISLEEPRRNLVVNTSVANSIATIPAPTGDQIKIRYPDVVGALRVDQTWGAAQIMGALHDASGGYYGTSVTGATSNGAPADKMGFAVGAGIRINTPFVSPGDYFQAQVNYTQGAMRYVAFTPAGAYNPSLYNGATSVGYGNFSDSIYSGGTSAGILGTGTAVQLTTAWGVNAAYEHFWTPALRTSLYGSYFKVSHNDTATSLYCGTAIGSATNTVASGACSSGMFDWSLWTVGSRSQWNVTKDFYVGFDVIYQALQTSLSGRTATVTALAAQPTATRTLENQSAVVGRIRVHRDIVP